MRHKLSSRLILEHSSLVGTPTLIDDAVFGGGRAEVTQLDVPTAAEEEVLCLQVSVQDGRALGLQGT